MNGLAATKARERAGRRSRRAWLRLPAWMLLFFVAASAGSAASLQDLFANRESLATNVGSITADNSTATVEPGEPKHGGKTGGHSLWISWIAPANGVVRFKTQGTAFDTLLAAYRFATTNDTTVDRLQGVVGEDDSEGFGRESEIEFGVQAGERYEIAVDGYYGAVGLLLLQWSFEPVTGLPPTILSTPADQAARQGDPVTLTVVLTNAADAQLKWFFNGRELDAATTTLLIPSLQPTNVGHYKLRIDVGGVRYFTVPAEVQINSDGGTNTLARGKLLDAPDTPLVGTGQGSSVKAASQPLLKVQTANSSSGVVQGLGSGVVRGYNGSQVFSTTNGTVDPAEPAHCGIRGGVSYWLQYQPPANGTITLDTIGSTYDTVMEVYTYNGALTGYADLISVGCDNDGVATNGPSRIQVPIVKTRPYLVVVQGVNGARGTAWINYSLNTNQPPQPPSLLSPPTPKIAAVGSNVVLAPSVTGSPPLIFCWKKDQLVMPGCTAPALLLPSVGTNDSANYIVTLTNDLGSLSVSMPLRVVVPGRSDLSQTAGGLRLLIPTVVGQRYTVEEAVAVSGPWQPWPNYYLGDGTAVVVYVPNNGTRFYRVRVE